MLVDLVRYFLHYLPLILLALPCIYWGTREIRSDRQWGGIFWTIGIAGLAVAGMLLLSSIPLATGHGWSGARLAPAAGWVRGYRLYYPTNEGPILVQMYGPVSAIAYLPVVWISHRPTSAIILGALTNALLYIAPAIWFIRRALVGTSTWARVVATTVFLLLSCRQFVLYEAVTRVTIDAPAIAFAVLAMTTIIGLKQGHFKWGVFCGAMVALSIWTKLTFIPLAGAVAIYVILISDSRSALRFIGGLTISCIGVTGLCLACFGPALILQNVTVPMHQPWQWPGLSRGDAYLRALHWLWRYSAFALGSLVFAILLALLNGKIAHGKRNGSFG